MGSDETTLVLVLREDRSEIHCTITNFCLNFKKESAFRDSQLRHETSRKYNCELSTMAY